MNFRKGVTPVVATVLLLGISVAATASAFSIITGAQEQTADNIQDRLDRQEREDQTDFNIEYAYEGQNGNLLLNIRNTGSRSLEIQDGNNKRLTVYADGQPVGSSSGDGWEFVDNEVDVLEPSEIFTMDTMQEFPDEDDEIQVEIYGPYQSSSSTVCFATGPSSC